jgi:hypothetical protein
LSDGTGHALCTALFCLFTGSLGQVSHQIVFHEQPAAAEFQARNFASPREFFDLLGRAVH